MSPAPHAPSDSGACSAGALFVALAAAMNEMNARASRLERRICAQGAALPPELREELQTLDLLQQELEGLSEFLTRLSMSPTAEAILEIGPALAPVKLSELKARLGGEAPHAPAAGEFEFL